MSNIPIPAWHHAKQFFDWLTDPSDEKYQAMKTYRQKMPEKIGRLYHFTEDVKIGEGCGEWFCVSESENFVDKPTIELSVEQIRTHIKNLINDQVSDILQPLDKPESKCLIPRKLNRLIQHLYDGKSVYIDFAMHNSEVDSDILDMGIDAQDLLFLYLVRSVDWKVEEMDNVVEHYTFKFATKGTFDLAIHGVLFRQGGDKVPSL